MNHLTHELQHVKCELTEMGQLVLGQLDKASVALLRQDQDSAHEVIANEKRVNSYELALDRLCANILALYSPVAVDLRFVLAVLKITTSLERIADNLESIAQYTLQIDHAFDKKLLDKLDAPTMFLATGEMLTQVMLAFDLEDPKLARKVFKKDLVLDELNHLAPQRLAEYIRANPDNIEMALAMLSIFRKLERIGDQTKNMGEEIIYYVKAKVVKHKRHRANYKKAKPDNQKEAGSE